VLSVLLIGIGCSSDAPEDAKFPPIEGLDLAWDLAQDMGPDPVPVTREEVLDYVDPFIGTSGLGFSYGGLTPAAQYPLGMVRVGPDSSAGSDYSTLINRFSG